MQQHDMIKAAIPAVRIAVARKLKDRYGMGQQEIAKRMGITQAAVNKYLNERYSNQIKKIVAIIEASGFDKRIAAMVASGKNTLMVNRNIDRAASAVFLKVAN